MTEYKIALVGFGGVNRALAQLIAERNARWQKELGLPMLLLSAAEETAPQLRRLLGQLAWRQRRR